MNAQEAAFLETDFRWTAALQSVWRDSPSHVELLQKDVADRIMGAFRPLFVEGAENVLGQPVNGPAGSGKTHLIGTLRRRVWEEGGWFVLIDLVGLTDFWKTTAFSFTRSLRQVMPDGRSQYKAVFDKVLSQIPEELRRERVKISGEFANSAIRAVNGFVKILQSAYPDAMEHSNVIRALLLQGDPVAGETAHGWLQGLEIDREERAAIGLTAPSPTFDALVRGISWLMSLSGPTMIAVDQIDQIVAAGNIVANRSSDLDDEAEARARTIFQLLTNGLMDLFDQTRRSMTVATCLGETWSLLREKTLQAALHRFSQRSLLLNSMTSDTRSLASLVSSRLAPAFTRHGVIPDQPTWPFTPSALAELEGHWPRAVLIKCEDYRLRFLNADQVPECTTFEVDAPLPPQLPVAPLDATYEKHVSAANIADLAAGLDDGGLLGGCLRDTLQLYLRQLKLPESIDAVISALQPEQRPSLHARLTFIFHDQKELEKHYCFRVLRHSSAQAVLPRLRAAMTDSGIDRKLPFRHLYIIRDQPMPTGPTTKKESDRLTANGGVVLPIVEADLRIFVALRDMAATNPEGFDAWLRVKQPLCETAFFRAAGLCPPPHAVAEAPPDPDKPAGVESTDAKPETAPLVAPPPVTTPAGVLPTAIPLGARLQGGGLGPVESLPLANLVRHTALFAGSGSGKTVLLRRIVEEAALAGIPAIVLDTNNDLARLGQAWPERPASFTNEDAEKAARYARDVEVAVWTPGVAAGRPLTLAVLPDFSAVAEGEERTQAIEMAWATLVPLVGASGAAKVPKEGLLKEALAAFASEGRIGIEAFIEFLADLPDGVSKQTKAQKYGVDMSDQLRGKVAVNPLLNAPGQPLDPAVLFAASRPGATRISVVNLAGLGTEAAQDFVNQLQMALFTFIKRHPSATPRLYVCDEAQNFAPSTTSTASKASAIALARQGRKFGLGMIFATQGPKGIDTNIVSNCLTHFYGRMSSPALIDATEEMMAAKGRAARDLGALTAGTFYFSTEGTPAPLKLKTPLCLSWHAKPATPEEVVALARG